MFGIVVAGRLLQTECQQIDETHIAFTIESATNANHICVFMLGTVPFPPGYAATVHFHWPGKGFQLLGMLSNEKPSAVFRLRGNYTPAQLQSHSTLSSAAAIGAPASNDVTAVLGIAVEPIQVVEAQINANSTARAGQANDNQLVKSAPQGLTDPTVLAERVVKHMFTYLSSFVSDPGSLSPDTVVPLNVIRRWYDSFLTKVRSGGISFLENQE
ncbi:Protein OPI10 homolog OS=Schizosaccharomyces pombe (strain 972 / ATCC 24843) GN=SPBC21H7,06c PE=3 SV=1 [Rhizoctonia solani AG-1 IB]|uniref:Protein OPI10 homolog n=1 Tax=Thanatephorus cucumeris (strain AG1-IB / isolate 7/3/14) TaxID=1108050 RepID=A0A0B7G0M6_THACB|nr:Protein OPI10 homolog OS=Schizosaccharomyces pombe (strain 972 / ATCC 24843) GN=SPBC21H7,06c PE=3 SV=1 [Rhizoctonia solani AG-1 IB]